MIITVFRKLLLLLEIPMDFSFMPRRWAPVVLLLMMALAAPSSGQVSTERGVGKTSAQPTVTHLSSEVALPEATDTYTAEGDLDLSSPTLDGSCQEYADFSPLPFGPNEKTVGWFRHNRTCAWLCLSGLDPKREGGELRVNLGSAVLRVAVAPSTGKTSVERIVGSTFKALDRAPGDVIFAVGDSTLEVRLDLGLLGGFGRTVPLWIGVRGASGGPRAWWPAASSVDTPRTWGALTLAPVFPATIDSGSLMLDGVGGVVLPPIPALDTATEATVEAWVRVLNLDCGTIISGGLATSFWIGTCDGYVGYGEAGAAMQQWGQHRLDEAWHHIALTFARNGKRVLYLDGQPEIIFGDDKHRESERWVKGRPFPAPAGLIRVGDDPALPEAKRALRGDVAGVAFWNRELSHEEILAQIRKAQQEQTSPSLRSQPQGRLARYPLAGTLQATGDTVSAGLVGLVAPDRTRMVLPGPYEPVAKRSQATRMSRTRSPRPSWDGTIRMLDIVPKLDGECDIKEYSGVSPFTIGPSGSVPLRFGRVNRGQAGVDGLYVCGPTLFGGLQPSDGVTLYLKNLDQSLPELKLEVRPDGTLISERWDERAGSFKPVSTAIARFAEVKVVTGPYFQPQDDIARIDTPWWRFELKIGDRLTGLSRGEARLALAAEARSSRRDKLNPASRPLTYRVRAPERFVVPGKRVDTGIRPDAGTQARPEMQIEHRTQASSEARTRTQTEQGTATAQTTTRSRQTTSVPADSGARTPETQTEAREQPSRIDLKSALKTWAEAKITARRDHLEARRPSELRLPPDLIVPVNPALKPCSASKHPLDTIYPPPMAGPIEDDFHDETCYDCYEDGDDDSWCPEYINYESWKWPFVDVESHRLVYAEGLITKSAVAADDACGVHSDVPGHDGYCYHDFEAFLQPGYDFLKYNNIPEDPVRLETESGSLPLTVRFSVGDHMTAVGEWIMDCGHAHRTELHPLYYVARDRERVRRTAWNTAHKVRTVDVSMNGYGGDAGSSELAQEFTFRVDVPVGEGPAFVRFVSLPPPYAPASIRTELDSCVDTTGSPIDRVVFTVPPPKSLDPNASDMGPYSMQFIVGRTPGAESAPPALEVRVVGLAIDDDDDNVSGGEWYMAVNLNGYWRELLPYQDVDDTAGLGEEDASIFQWAPGQHSYYLMAMDKLPTPEDTKSGTDVCVYVNGIEIDDDSGEDWDIGMPQDLWPFAHNVPETGVPVHLESARADGRRMYALDFHVFRMGDEQLAVLDTFKPGTFTGDAAATIPKKDSHLFEPSHFTKQYKLRTDSGKKLLMFQVTLDGVATGEGMSVESYRFFQKSSEAQRSLDLEFNEFASVLYRVEGMNIDADEVLLADPLPPAADGSHFSECPYVPPFLLNPPTPGSPRLPAKQVRINARPKPGATGAYRVVVRPDLAELTEDPGESKDYRYQQSGDFPRPIDLTTAPVVGWDH